MPTTIESLDALADATAAARTFRLAWDEARAAAAAAEAAFVQAEQRLIGLARRVAGCVPAAEVLITDDPEADLSVPAPVSAEIAPAETPAATAPPEPAPGELVELPTWRKLTLEAAGFMAGEDAFETEVCAALVDADVTTCGQLADALLKGEMFGLRLTDVESLWSAIEMISEDDAEPIRFTPAPAADQDEDDLTPEPKREYKPLDEQLRQALHSTQGAVERWAKRAKNGLTDEALKQAIGVEFGDGGRLGGGYDYRTKGGKGPAFWCPDVHRTGDDRTPTLAGMALLNKVRELLGVPLASHTGDKITPAAGSKAADAPVKVGDVVRTSYGTGPYVVTKAGLTSAGTWSLTVVDADAGRTGKKDTSYLNGIKRETDGRLSLGYGRDELLVVPKGQPHGPCYFDWCRDAGLVRENGNKDLQRMWMRGEPAPEAGTFAPTSEPLPAEKPVPKKPTSKKSKTGAKVTKVMLASGPATIASHPDAVVPGEPIPSFEVGAKPAGAAVTLEYPGLVHLGDIDGIPTPVVQKLGNINLRTLNDLLADVRATSQFEGGDAAAQIIAYFADLKHIKKPDAVRAADAVINFLVTVPRPELPAPRPAVTLLSEIDDFPDVVFDKMFHAGITSLETLMERMEEATQLLGDMPVRNKLTTFFVNAGLKIHPAQNAAAAVCDHIKNATPAPACPPWRDRTLAEAGVTEGPAAWATGTLQQLKKAGVETFGHLADKLLAGETFSLLREPLREMCDAVEALSSADPEPITFADVPKPVIEAEPKAEAKPEPAKKPPAVVAGEKPYGWDITYLTTDGQELRCHYTGTEVKARRRTMARPKAKHVIKCEPLTEREYTAAFGRGGM